MAHGLGGSPSGLIRKVITGKCPEAAQAVSHPASLKAFISEFLDYVVPDGIKIHEKKNVDASYITTSSLVVTKYKKFSACQCWSFL